MPARSPSSRVTDEPGPVPAGACGDVRRSCEICLRNKSGCHHLSWPESQCSQTSVRLDALRKSVGRASLSVRSRSSVGRWQRISSAENVRRTSETNEEAPWRKPDAQWRRWRNSSVFISESNGRPPPERSVALFWLGSKLDNVALWESGTGPFSRIAGLLLFPLRPSRGNCLSATTRFRFQWRRNRFACHNVLLWRFSGRPNWRSG